MCICLLLSNQSQYGRFNIFSCHAEELCHILPIYPNLELPDKPGNILEAFLQCNCTKQNVSETILNRCLVSWNGFNNNLFT